MTSSQTPVNDTLVIYDPLPVDGNLSMLKFKNIDFTETNNYEIIFDNNRLNFQFHTDTREVSPPETFFTLTSTGQVGIGEISPIETAILDISSTSKGILIPRMTAVERNAIQNPAEALMVYDTDSSAFYYADDAQNWVKFLGVTQSNYIESEFWSINPEQYTIFPTKKELNVGIGTDNAKKQLHIKTNLINPVIRLEENAGTKPQLYAWDIENSTTQLNLKYEYSNTEILNTVTKFSFTADNKLGIGTATPLEQLNIYSENQNSTLRLENKNPLNSKYQIWNIENSNTKLKINYKKTSTRTDLPETQFTFAADSKLGIGTENPQKELHIKNVTSSVIRLENTFNETPKDTTLIPEEKAIIHYSWDIRSEEDYMYFDFTKNTAYKPEKVKISSTGTVTAKKFVGEFEGMPEETWLKNETGDVYYSVGNVGIGTISPLVALHIEKDYREEQGYTPPAIILKENKTDGTDMNYWKIENNMKSLIFKYKDFDLNTTSAVLTMHSLDININANAYIHGNTTIYGNIIASGDILANDVTANDVSAKYLEINELGNTLKFDASNGDSPTCIENETSVQIGSSTGLISFFYEGSQYTDGYNTVACGNIWSKGEIIVDNNFPWCDYVFESDYELMSLYDLENFISTQKHLPEMPTTCDVEENGQNIGEINGLLVKKIEELTLYIIDLQKQIDELKTTKEE